MALSSLSIPVYEQYNEMHPILKRKQIFVNGKGGVGKTVVSRAIAEALSRQSRRVLWVSFERADEPTAELTRISPQLWRLKASAVAAFEEYASLKVGIPFVGKLFARNRLIQYMAKAAPGIHELVLLGKVWHERQHYDHVVTDMPSTGYGLAMFQSVHNFSRLFRGGPIQRDAQEMLSTLGDPQVTGQVIVALPEETPLREALELGDTLRSSILPSDQPLFIANRCFPERSPGERTTDLCEPKASPESWPTPFADSLQDYATKRRVLEAHNLRIWRSQGAEFIRLPWIPPDHGEAQLASRLADAIGGATR